MVTPALHSSYHTHTHSHYINTCTPSQHCPCCNISSRGGIANCIIKFCMGMFFCLSYYRMSQALLYTAVKQVSVETWDHYNRLHGCMVGVIVIHYVAGMMDEQELLQVTRHIPLDHYVEICAKSGRVGSQTTPSEDTLVAVLMAWQQDSPNNRRNKLARVLLSMGCYGAALKLDAKCKHNDRQ